MNSLQLSCEKSIPQKCNAEYKGIAFDCNYFYITCPDLCEIIKYDKCFCEMECFKTEKPYNNICYDYRENCFWASTKKCCGKLFKLDCCFNEIGCIVINNFELQGESITGLSYDCLENRILVSYLNCIISISKSDCSDKKIIQKNAAGCNLGVVSISPSYGVIEEHPGPNISFYDCCANLKIKFDIPYEYCVESIILNPCIGKSHGKYNFYMLANKKKCDTSYLLEFSLDSCDVEVDNCNFYCKKSCPKPPCPHPKDSCNDLIESIALIETAIAQILNTEGEKLQKIIANTDNIDKILSANEVISEAITKITHLEIILYDKLSIIQKCCCNCKHTCL